jgi:hypothetical protein
LLLDVPLRLRRRAAIGHRTQRGLPRELKLPVIMSEGPRSRPELNLNYMVALRHELVLP